MDWDKKIVSKELLLYLREQLVAALDTNSTADRRFEYTGITATVLVEAIRVKQSDSELEKILLSMCLFASSAMMGQWHKCHESDFSIEKIQAIYAQKSEKQGFKKS
jgi:hypothetical protein